MLQAAPNTTSEEIVIGIVAGILTSAVLALAGVVVTKILLPWYRGLTYRGVDLEDEWSSTAQEHGANYMYKVNLRQSAHDLRGAATITKRGAGVNDYNDVFDVSGFTWEGYVSLTLRSVNRKRLSFATALLHVDGRGERLKGHWAYRSGHADEVESEPIELVRAR